MSVDTAMIKRAFTVVLLLMSGLALGCGDATPTPAKPATGTATLRFSATSTVRSSMNLIDPLKGIVYGSLFLSEDVAVTGPRDGSPSFANVEVAIDLDAADPSEATWTSPPLELNRYVFLGFFDVDGNGAEINDPDPGDPVTLPFTNQFDIEENKESSATVNFDLVYN
jgi:hypothetical protein